MIRAIRRKLRSIRYHSARRPETPWSRALDNALIWSFLLCLPLAWASGALFTRTSTLVWEGQIERLSNGKARVLMWDEAKPTDPWNQLNVQPFEVRIQRGDHGFPIVISFTEQPATIWVETGIGANPWKWLDPATDPSSAELILAALDRTNPDVAERLRATSPRHSTSWLRLLAAAPIWWLLLFAAAVVVIGLLRAALTLGRAIVIGRRKERVDRGICPSCGYDLRASVFSERCPECGELLT